MSALHDDGMLVKKPPSKTRYLIIGIVMFALDQATKYWVWVTRRNADDFVVIPGFLNISYTENPGIAFGMLNSGGFRWILVAVSCLAIVVVIYYAIKAPAANRLLLWSLALLSAGITGNLADRIRMGRVIDFIQAYIEIGGTRYEWPVFNVADTAITIGAGLMAMELLLAPADDSSSNNKGEHREPEQAPAGDAITPSGDARE
jgi:signal peptidase II